MGPNSQLGHFAFITFEILTKRVKAHLAEGTEVKAERLGIAGTCVQVVAQQQHKFQQAAKGAARLDFIAGGVYSQNIWTQVVDLLVKLQSEEDVVESWAQSLHAAHLGHNKQTEDQEKGGEVT